MPDDLRPVPIQELRLSPDQGVHWNLDRHLPQLDSLTKVRGWIVAVHLGTALEVRGEAETIVTLCCHRCLQPYNHRLRCEVKELIWLGSSQSTGSPTRAGEPEDPPSDFDPDGLSERMDPRGCFDPAHWIFEQLHLQLPLVNRCGDHCPGPALPSRDSHSRGPGVLPGQTNNGDDPRWARLAALLHQHSQAGSTPSEPAASEPAP